MARMSRIARGFQCVGAVMLTLLAPSFSSATEQAWDKLLFGDMQYFTPQCPLMSLWIDKDGKGELPDFDEMGTGNRKGYEATWEIRESKLYLKKFKAKRDGNQVLLSDVTPGYKVPCEATWFTGRIILPMGDYDPGTRRFTVLLIAQIDKGKVTGFTLETDKVAERHWNGTPPSEATEDRASTK